ncbi:hypothetical protein BJP40_22650 [Streptomyces sp. CC53]|uniref:hypothetical protein n=1 Tax=unclassified Streptomyces TaxID=2593676 RepID=UPI0008DD44E5|nr:MULTISPECIES: hypothetical protein [unclassified Streptomyces]OII63872.1 hypothetical protein BJP40_22650 [Streptomyces sp. CC53]
MISEPELVDANGRPLGQGRDGGDLLDSDAPPSAGPGGPRGRRPWLWALGGVVVASALWAGGLHAYQGRGVGLGGYRAVEDLCEVAELKALETALGQRSDDSPGPDRRHEAVDRLACDVQFGDGRTTYSVQVGYELHKKADPGVEFDAYGIGFWWGNVYDAEPVPGVGERALYAAAMESAALRVLDGQATLELWVSPVYEYDEGETPVEPDATALEGIKDFMAEDAKALMAGLRGGG